MTPDWTRDERYTYKHKKLNLANDEISKWSFSKEATLELGNRFS